LQLALVEWSAVVRADVSDGVDVAVDVAQEHLDTVDDHALGGCWRDLVKFGDRLGHAAWFAKGGA
jgi:hypothetical protein